MPRKSTRNLAKLVAIQGATATEARALKILTLKNVKYIQGVPRPMLDLERVYVIELVSPQITQTLVSGTKATSTSLDPTARLDGWASRWASVFKQYVVLSCRVITSVQATNGGAAANGSFFIRVEEDSSAPTGSIVRAERGVLNLHAPSDDKQTACVACWEPTSSEDLEFISTGTGYAMSYFKVYADPTNTGTSASDLSSSVVSYVVYRLAFRYLQ